MNSHTLDSHSFDGSVLLTELNLDAALVKAVADGSPTRFYAIGASMGLMQAETVQRYRRLVEMPEDYQTKVIRRAYALTQSDRDTAQDVLKNVTIH